jgi:hypothetical protein
MIYSIYIQLQTIKEINKNYNYWLEWSELIRPPAKTSYTYTQFIYSNREVYIAFALCSKLLHSAIAI